MGLQYRCSLRKQCGARRTLSKPIDQYVRRPKCKGCKKDTLKPVYQKEYERGLRRKCTCRGNHWIHVPRKIIDKHRTCIHADPFELQVIEEFGGSTDKMKLTDDCPF